MNCIYCSGSTRVLDKRESSEGSRRRRECINCGKRFTTYERAEPRIVVKKDSRREPFSQEKLIRSIRIACQKRPISMESITTFVENLQTRLHPSETPTSLIGEWVMEWLKKTDSVAYIRFASVYNSFENLSQFENIIEVIKCPKNY